MPGRRCSRSDVANCVEIGFFVGSTRTFSPKRESGRRTWGSPWLLGKAQHPLTEDVALNLARTAENRLSTAHQHGVDQLRLIRSFGGIDTCIHPQHLGCEIAEVLISFRGHQ